MSFAVVDWLDVFTRKEYKDILLENLVYCQKQKGMEIYAWCIMSNHLHLIFRSTLAPARIHVVHLIINIIPHIYIQLLLFLIL